MKISINLFYASEDLLKIEHEYFVLQNFYTNLQC